MSGARQSPDALRKQRPTTRGGAKKDRKRWCKGKPGREHDYQVQVQPNGWGSHGTPSSERRCQPHNWPTRYDWWICKHAAICQNCGRQESITKQQCPEWKETA